MKKIRLNSFWKGFLSVFNIFGTRIELPKSFEKSDKENIADDWKQIGNDFKSIISNYEKR